MKKADVVDGGTYAAKVSGRVVTVRVLRASPLGGWDARNELTGRGIRIKSAAKLRYAVRQEGERWVRAS